LRECLVGAGAPPHIVRLPECLSRIVTALRLSIMVGKGLSRARSSGTFRKSARPEAPGSKRHQMHSTVYACESICTCTPPSAGGATHFPSYVPVRGTAAGGGREQLGRTPSKGSAARRDALGLSPPWGPTRLVRAGSRDGGLRIQNDLWDVANHAPYRAVFSYRAMTYRCPPAYQPLPIPNNDFHAPKIVQCDYARTCGTAPQPTSRPAIRNSRQLAPLPSHLRT
jgi:hypothetical protein